MSDLSWESFETDFEDEQIEMYLELFELANQNIQISNKFFPPKDFVFSRTVTILIAKINLDL